jgi:hypothetical protein
VRETFNTRCNYVNISLVSNYKVICIIKMTFIFGLRDFWDIVFLHNTHNTVKTKKESCRATSMLQQRVEDVQFLLILDLGTRWGELSASPPSRDLLLGKDPHYPLGMRLGGTQSRSGHTGWRKNFFLCRDRTPIA